jgi:paired small multidrug resistance pump
MRYSFTDFLGNIGVVLIIIAYLLLQLNRVCSNSLSYSLLNAVGASLIIISLIFNFNLSAFIMEAIWVVISLFGLYRYFRPQPLKQ